MRRWIGALGALSALLAGAAGVGAADKPNIVLILIDDMGYGDIGPFGSTRNRTPNLDRMAKEGMRLTSFYAAPVCSVSRAQVMTGCYGVRVSVPGVFFPCGKQGLNPQEHTVAELLKGCGYATQCIGKWHLGDQPPFLPTRRGFDHYLGLPYSNDMIKTSVETGKGAVPLMRDDKVAELLDGDGQDRMTERYTDEAVKFIQESKGKPFFLYFPHSAVHVPLHPGAKFQGKSQNGRYGDWVEEVDWSVGRVLDTIREAGLEKNTMVLFTSDNGPWLVKGKDGGEAGPLRGGKGSTWEGGMREPTIAWWPGRVPAGASCDTVAGTIDLLPTFVSLAGGTVPADRKIDGADISRLLLGQTKEPAREAHFYYNGYKLQAVRSGPWKLALVAQASGMGGKDIDESAKGQRLYNLDADIGEKTNVAEQNPEVVKRLKALADRMAEELCDGSPNGPGVRPPGVVEKPEFLYPVKAEAPKENAKKKKE
jgi:arylsulfatase A-like enzyme